MDFVDFLVSGARRTGALATPEGTLAAATTVLDAIRRVKNPILIDGYLRRAAQALDVPDSDLRSQFEGKAGQPAPRRRPAPALPPLAPEASAPISVPSSPSESELLRLMLQHGLLMVEHVLSRMSLEEFASGPMRQTVELILAQFQAGAIDPGPFVRGEHGEAIRSLVVEVLAKQHQRSDNWERKLEMEVAGKDARPTYAADSAMKRLKLARIEEAIAEAKRRLMHAEREGADPTPIQREIVMFADLRRRIDEGDLLAAAE